MLLIPIKEYQFIRSGRSSAPKWIYCLLLILCISLFISLFYIEVDISIKAPGIIRPANERTEVKPFINGIIDTLLQHEGSKVQKGDIILRIKNLNTKSKKILHSYEITQRQQCIHDLVLLTTGNLTAGIADLLQSPVYKEQLTHFLSRKSEQDLLLAKADKEVAMHTPLAKDKIISPKEFYDIENNQQKILAGSRILIQSQISSWQQDLTRYRSELSQFEEQMNQVNTNATYDEIKAPVSGTILGIHSRYPGGMIQAGETICTISPEGELVGECFVPGKDIGLLKPFQPVRYQVDAYNYNYFGVFTGKLLSIDNDITVIDNKPLFRIRCSFTDNRLPAKNGFTAQLKKGLGFQASFLVARRSLSQLLFDRLDDWLDPAAPLQTPAKNIEKSH